MSCSCDHACQRGLPCTNKKTPKSLKVASDHHHDHEDFRETLYTIDRKGNRQWVYAQHIFGDFFRKRTLVAAILLTLYLSLPWITIGDSQAVLLNISERQFTFFGSTFWATDTKLLVVVLGFLGFSLFFFTALLGRVWCGWACPETIFLEFIFRPIERLIEGVPSARRKLDRGSLNRNKFVKKALKWSIYLCISWWLASTFLAYFFGRDPLLLMMREGPLLHLAPFIGTLFMMGVVLFQFGYFREQFCTVLCPYARFQSVLLDSDSLVVGYDKKRGEPRGKNSGGDCIDCGLCQKVCPTGIDIRNGLQLECVNCTACIDACNSIMTKVGKPVGLIRYATERVLEGGIPRLIRPRVIAYGVILLIYGAAFTYLLSTRSSLEYQIIRQSRVAPYTVISEQLISNQLHIHLTNKSNHEETVSITLKNPSDGTLIVPGLPMLLPARTLKELPLFLTIPREKFHHGEKSITVLVTSGEVTTESTFKALGPG